MQASAIGAVAPAALLCAALGSWNLISLCFLIAFFVVQFKSQRRDLTRPRPGLWMPVVLLATWAIVAEGLVTIGWIVYGADGVPVVSEWFELLGLARLDPWDSSSGVFRTLGPQFAVVLTAACALYHEQHATLPGTHHVHYDEDTYQWRANLLSFVLPTVQIVAGVARPSWIALPYFVCSCAGLLHWSMTSNFVGLSWGWRPLMLYTGTHITLQYIYQLPVSFPQKLDDRAEYVGLYKISLSELGWAEGIQCVSLVALFMLLCVAVNDMDEDRREQAAEARDSLPTRYTRSNASSFRCQTAGDDALLTESLLPSDQQTSHRDTMNSRRRVVEQRRMVAFQLATINFFTYGFPICMVALIGWSFVYASLCAFALLLYVGYIFFAFPTVTTLRRLNPLLLVFILLYAMSTYVFNAAFSIMKTEFDLGTEIWHLIGLWHYSTPGLFIFAQYALGVLIATDIFVSNNIMHSLSESGSPSGEDTSATAHKDHEDKKVVVLAVFAWFVRKSAHMISLILIFNVGLKDGLLHAVYMGFFLLYLVSASAAKATRQALVLLCELHFAVLYVLQLDWISTHLADHAATLKPILSLLGLWHKAKLQDFVGIAVLLIFSAVQNHGLKVASSLSATVQHSPQPPLGWGILQSDNGRTILLSVYSSTSSFKRESLDTSARWVTKLLAATAEKIRCTYHMFGTYIAYCTVLLVICSVDPNYVAFGYLCLLLFWIVGRQVLGNSRNSCLWLPLLVYATLVFVARYILSAFPILQRYVDAWVPLYPDLGFDPAASLWQHLWDSLVILIVMEVYKFERSQKVLEPDDDADDQGAVDRADSSTSGSVGFGKRLLILHGGKLLSVAVFYAAITPVSAVGFLYLIMLVVTCNMSKSSRLPGQTYVLYTAAIVVSEYLFQMWGRDAKMFPGQAHGDFAFWLGLRVFERGFWGVESGLCSRVVVLAMCILQCTTLGWLELLPASLRVDTRYEEPCSLFLPHLHRTRSTVVRHPNSTEPLPGKFQRKAPASETQPAVARSQSVQPSSASGSVSTNASSSSVGQVRRPEATINKTASTAHPTLESPWGSLSENRRWTKRAMLLLKQERYEAQLRTLSIIFKHRMEHFCQLYGLELSMFALLISSFALLNVFSLFYIFVLALCILLPRRTLRILWPFFVVLFACVMVTEYAVLGGSPPQWSLPPLFEHALKVQCHECWSSYTSHHTFCWRCWLGLTVDDRQMLAAHFVAFIVACFQLRANMSAGVLDPRSLHAGILPASDRLAWKEISYETTAQWTWLDYLRFGFYRHLLHVVLLLVFITGTLQYDVLHLGYLAMSLIFFRMRGTIMQCRNSIFCFLRLYNFILIVASLIYQAPYFGGSGGHTCTLPQGLYSYIGLYKYDHGFRITERSALVDITIFCLVGLQAHIFRSCEFEQVLRYLEAQQVEARAHAQEDKAAWKKEQLQRIRAMEERKHHRRKQVEKMKYDMLHMQLRLEVLDSTGPQFELAGRGKDSRPSASPFSHQNESPRRPSVDTPRVLERIASETAATRGPDSGPKRGLSFEQESPPAGIQGDHRSDESGEEYVSVRRRKPAGKKKSRSAEDALATDRFERQLRKAGSDIASTGVDRKHGGDEGKHHHSRQVLMSGVQLLEEGVAQVQSLGNKALANLVGLLNLENEDDSTESSSTEDEAVPASKTEEITVQELMESSTDPPTKLPAADETSHPQSYMNETWRRLFMLFYFLYSQLRSNTDIVCYFFFVLVYVWNFSFLTLVFPAALFLYALLVNPGPSQYFWLAMLIYIETNILLQYCYQIHQQHCADNLIPPWLRKFGIPGGDMKHSFVISVLPLFLVYLATLVQSSIKARDGEWMFVSEANSFASSRRAVDPGDQTGSAHRLTVRERTWSLIARVGGWFTSFKRGLLRYFQALTRGSEAPPHFVQVSMDVGKWPEAGIQPERIESGFNRLLASVRQSRSFDADALDKDSCSRVCVESIESSPDRPGTALAVLEVIYAAPSHACRTDAHHLSLTPAADLAAELLRAKDENLVDATGFLYPILSVIPGGKREVDLYAYIFGTDLVTFLFVALFYQPFLKHSFRLIDVTQVEDQFPKAFVFVLMTLFFLIVVDRVLYLCSSASGKVVYYLFSLVLYTAYVSQFVWTVESYVEPAEVKNKHGLQLLPLRVFYMMKALSLAFQALQIKYGLPHKSALYRQFLARRINLTSWVGFRLYRALPFLFELRCVLDWSCTTTALNMYDWLKLEDIYGSLFLVQCDIKLMREKHRLGQKQGMWIKFCSGVLLFAILIAVIWAPMLIYSSGNPTNTPNLVMDVRAGIEVKTAGGIFKLYETGLCHNHTMDLFPEADYPTLAGYEPRDVQVICCEPGGASLWLIPPATLKSLIRSIEADDLVFSSWWEFHRERPKEKELASYRDPSGSQEHNNVLADQLKAVLNGTRNSVYVANLYPRYFRVPGSGEVHRLEGSAAFISGNLTLNREGVQTWWSFERDGGFETDGCGLIMGPAAITVSEEVPPKGLIGETLSKFSIWSLYITFVLAVGRFIRLQCSDIRMRIPYENFPACDRLVAICEDIYAARAAGELELEEGLFWTLVKIYRAPYILMEYTKVE